MHHHPVGHMPFPQKFCSERRLFSKTSEQVQINRLAMPKMQGKRCAADKPHVCGEAHCLNPFQKIQGACEDCFEV